MNRSDNLPECRDDYGSSWEDSGKYVLKQESAQCTMTSSEETLGLRLARDVGAGMKPVRGSKFYSVYGIGVFTQEYPEYRSFVQLGFRLVRDVT